MHKYGKKEVFLTPASKNRKTRTASQCEPSLLGGQTLQFNPALGAYIIGIRGGQTNSSALQNRGVNPDGH
jgi:hypothetical protein